MQSVAGLWRHRFRGLDQRAIAQLLLVAVPALAIASALVWLLEERFGVPDASPVYLLAVVVTALASGTLGALAAAIVGILLYDFLFTHPFATFEISDPGEWLSLVLLLFVGLVVGQLTAIQRARTMTAETREREAREQFLVSRALATRSSTATVLEEIAALLQRAMGMRAVWIALGPGEAAERVAAEAGERAPTAGLYWQLRRMPGDEPAQWIRIHAPATGRARAAATDAFRVRIEAGTRPLGSIWATRERQRALPDRSATRLISAAADQVGQVLAQDRLEADARVADVARQSDALKSALLQSVSHDLRTPLATIRAAAGSLQPDSDLDEDGRRASAAAIEREVERLDRLVANLLDLSRIEAGELRADIDVFELDDLAGRTIDRLAPRLADRDVQVEVPAVPVLVDAVFLDEVLTNLLDNALKFTGSGSRIRVAAAAGPTGVRLTVEDDGTGVPDEFLPRLFDKFFRVPSSPAGGAAARRGRPGTRRGLGVVSGLAQALGGEVSAKRSQLGGLAVEVVLPRAELPAELAGTTA